MFPVTHTAHTPSKTEAPLNKMHSKLLVIVVVAPVACGILSVSTHDQQLPTAYHCAYIPSLLMSDIVTTNTMSAVAL